MAEIIWTEPALADLDAIADYIALDKPDAASAWVKRVFERVGHLQAYPESGTCPPELKRSRYRQIIEPPCRVFYRYDGERVYILYVMRAEQLLRPSRVAAREKAQAPTPKKRP